ncbi:hypothetical protein BC829DRAFT_209617 [Chytridium lagenaria]|nr:hypothetical protein BC829DRAFT_209617 [Chytridium lagenaria]
MTPLTCIHCLNAFLSPAKLAYHIDTSHAQIEVLALYKGRLCVMRRASGTCRCGDRECGGEYECAVCEYTAGNRRTLKIHLGKNMIVKLTWMKLLRQRRKCGGRRVGLLLGWRRRVRRVLMRHRGDGDGVVTLNHRQSLLRRTQSVVDNGEEGEASSKPLRRTRVIAVEEVVEVKEKTIRFDEGGEGIGVDIAVKRTWTQDVEEVVKVGGEENGEDAKLSIRTISMEPVEKMEMDEEGEEEEEEEESEVARLLKRTRSRSKEISEEIKPLRRTRSTIGDEEVAEVRPVKRRGRSSLIDEEVQSRKRAIVDEPVAKRTRGREVGSLPRTRSGVIVSPKKKVMGKMEDDKSPASRRGKAETVVLTAKTEVVEKFYEETSSGEVDINFVGGNDISTDRESPESLTADSAPDENNDSPTSMDMDYGSVVSRPASLAGVAVAAISEMMTPWVKSIGKMVGWAKGGLRRVLGGRVEKKKVGVKSATTVL